MLKKLTLILAGLISTLSLAQSGPYADGTYAAVPMAFAPSPLEQQNLLLDFLGKFLGKGESPKSDRDVLKAELEKSNVLAVAIAHDAYEVIPQLLKAGASPQDLIGAVPIDASALSSREYKLANYSILVYALIDFRIRNERAHPQQETNPTAHEIARGQAICALSRFERRLLPINTGLDYLKDYLVAGEYVYQAMSLLRSCGLEGLKKVSKVPVYSQENAHQNADGSWSLDVPSSEAHVQEIPDELLGPDLARQIKGQP